MLASIALGAAVFIGLMWYFARAHSFQWRAVSQAYARRSRKPPLARKPMDTIVIAERGATGPLASGGLGWRQYPGVRIEVHEDALALSLIPPFDVMCPPLLLPYDEMETVPTGWALWPDPVAIRMKRAPKVDIVIARDCVRWLREHSDAGPFGSSW